MLKKLNAILTWLLTIALLAHLITMSYSFFTGWYNYSLCKALAHSTSGLVFIHALLSLGIVMLLHDGASISCYAKKNIGTIIQRFSAIVLMCLVHSHIKEYSFIAAHEQLAAAAKAKIIVIELLFWGALFLHLSESLTKSLITLGLIRSDKAEKRARISVKLCCLLLMLLVSTAMLRFVIMW